MEQVSFFECFDDYVHWRYIKLKDRKMRFYFNEQLYRVTALFIHQIILTVLKQL